MANKRLSDLPVVTSTTTGDVVAIDGATTRQITTENLLGDNVQSIKTLTSAADKVPYFTGAGTSDVADFTSYGRSIVAVADEAAFKALTNLEIGTDVQAYNSALDAVSGTNTGDQTITLTGDVTGTGTGSFATTISATAVTSSMLNPDVFSTAHSWSGQQTFVAPALGTPASGVATNLTGTASGLTAGHVTTNANLTGDVTSVGNATTIGSTKVTSSMLNADVFSSTHTWSGVQTFSAAPVVPTQSPSDNSTKAASTAYVDAQVSAGVSGVSSLNGKTGALVAYFPPQGRITLVSGSPVMTSSQAGAGTVYYALFNGNLVPIYDGTNMVPTVFSELSQATTDTTKSPAAVAASSLYDLFVWNDSGTIRCTRGPAWTNDTTRSAGTALVLVDGLYLNNASITNGPAAQRGTYVGTIGSNSSSLIDFIFGSSGTGGVAANFGVWNAFNRLPVSTMVLDSTSSWTYATVAWRAANNSSGNRVTCVRGLDIDGCQFTYSSITLAGSGSSTVVGIGLNTTTALSGISANCNLSTTSLQLHGSYNGLMGLGRRFASAIEYSTSTTSSNFYGSPNATLQSGLSGLVWQ